MDSSEMQQRALGFGCRCAQYKEAHCRLNHERTGMAVSEQMDRRSAPKAGGLPPEAIIFGSSAAMSAIRQKVQKIIGTDVPVLIQGENGTGK